MRLTYIKVPERHFQEFEHQLVFRHDWRGQDLYWIVPMIYVVKYTLKDGTWTVKLSEAYWQVSTNRLAA